MHSEFLEAGFYQRGAHTWVLLAEPFSPPAAAQADQVQARVLALVNEARSRPQRCGNQAFAAAPPLRLNPALYGLASAHAADMARYDYFSHTGRDGSTVDSRANAPVRWRRHRRKHRRRPGECGRGRARLDQQPRPLRQHHVARFQRDGCGLCSEHPEQPGDLLDAGVRDHALTPARTSGARQEARHLAPEQFDERRIHIGIFVRNTQADDAFAIDLVLNLDDSFVLCARSMTKIRSAHSTRSGVRGLSAPLFRPAEEHSRPGYFRENLLRRRAAPAVQAAKEQHPHIFLAVFVVLHRGSLFEKSLNKPPRARWN